MSKILTPLLSALLGAVIGIGFAQGWGLQEARADFDADELDKPYQMILHDKLSLGLALCKPGNRYLAG